MCSWIDVVFIEKCVLSLRRLDNLHSITQTEVIDRAGVWSGDDHLCLSSRSIGHGDCRGASCSLVFLCPWWQVNVTSQASCTCFPAGMTWVDVGPSVVHAVVVFTSWVPRSTVLTVEHSLGRKEENWLCKHSVPLPIKVWWHWIPWGQTRGHKWQPSISVGQWGSNYAIEMMAFHPGYIHTESSGRVSISKCFLF